MKRSLLGICSGVLVISLTAGVLAVGAAVPSARPSTAVTPGSALYQYTKDLFMAAQSGESGNALFFPLAGYIQIKAVGDAKSDYTNRLLYGYHLDLGALGRLIVSHGSGAVFVGAEDQSNALTWVSPGSCGNRMGYWHLPGVRVVYRVKGATYSFAILSMIAWRGKLYVIHLGAFSHPTGVGVVAQPEPGPGYPWGPGGC